MAIWSIYPPEFQPNDRVVSLVYHPPEIEPGTKATIVMPRTGPLYAVQTPDGELHRWFASFELEPINQQHNYWGLLWPGSYAKIITAEGHHHVKPGTIVKIVKVIAQIPFYDVMVEGKGYHRWLAEFEIASLDVVTKS